MRAIIKILTVCLLTVLACAAATPRSLSVPTSGSGAERIIHMWQQTREIIVADAASPHTDAEWVALGAPLIEPWTSLETKFGESEEASKARAVVKLLNDVYGRAYSTPERRRPMRTQALQSLSERLNDLEGRIKH